MANGKREALERLIRRAQDEEGEEEASMLGKTLDVLDTPGRATRAAIGAYQQDKPVLGAIKEQFSANRPEAPSGEELATRFSDKYDVNNPAVLTALATLAEVADPSMLVPGGQVGKLGKIAGMAKGVGKGRKVAGKAVEMGSDTLRAAKGQLQGKTAVIEGTGDALSEAAMKGRGQLAGLEDSLKRMKSEMAKGGKGLYAKEPLREKQMIDFLRSRIDDEDVIKKIMDRVRNAPGVKVINPNK